MNTTISNSPPPADQHPFGTVIFSYTRAQALADGLQVDVSTTAKDAGITFPVFLTRAVFDTCVAVPEGIAGQDEAGRLWDVVWMLRHGIRRSVGGGPIICFSLYVRNNHRAPKLVKLKAVCGPLDMDQPEPAITVMFPDED